MKITERFTEAKRVTTKRFNKAKKITLGYLENGNYRWHPSTLAGWVIRIACTDVGQGAWQLAKSSNDASDATTPPPESVDGSSETDSEPEPAQPDLV